VDIVSVSQIGLPQQFSSSAPALQAGQIVDALVLALLEHDTVRLALPGLVLDARSTIPLVPGQTVRVAVQSSASGLELVIIGDSAHSATASDGQARGQAATAGTPTGPNSEGGATASASGQATIVEIAGARLAPPTTAAAPESANAVSAEVIGQAARVAASRQGGLAPLLANVVEIVRSPQAAPPKPVVQAALGLLGLTVPLDEKLAGNDIKTAFVRSGLFLEAQLAPQGNRNGGGAATSDQGAMVAKQSTSPTSGATTMNPGATGGAPVDLKAALLVFREVVKLWLDEPVTASAPSPVAPEAGVVLRAPAAPNENAVAPPSGAERPVAITARAAPPPPYRGAPPAAQPATVPSIERGSAPADIAQKLLVQTDAALARHTLLQVASLPDQPQGAGHRTDAQGPQWLFEVPFATRQGVSIAQFEIGRDAHAQGSDGRVIWRARFSLDIEPMGPVHAQVSVLGERAAVTLWAERDGSAARLRDSTAMLSEALRGAALEPGDIQCRVGAPMAPRQAAGRFLDQAS